MPTQIAALTCALCLAFGLHGIASEPKRGFIVLLGSSCPAGIDDERRDLVVRYLPNNKLWLNEEPLAEGSLRSKLQADLSTRMEKIVWVAADEHVSYGEVVGLISKLNHDTPDLHIAIATKSQTGPVDPTDADFRTVQQMPGRGIGTLCLH